MRPYPQPREGISGALRPADDPLMTGLGSVLVADLTAQLYKASHSGSSPHLSELFHRMSAPEVGDRVVVRDSIRSDPETRFQGVGYLVAARVEWATSERQWLEEKARYGLFDADRVVEREVWYVQYGPDPYDVCRWVNCTVLAIPPATIR